MLFNSPNSSQTCPFPCIKSWVIILKKHKLPCSTVGGVGTERPRSILLTLIHPTSNYSQTQSCQIHLMSLSFNYSEALHCHFKRFDRDPRWILVSVRAKTEEWQLTPEKHTLSSLRSPLLCSGKWTCSWKFLPALLEFSRTPGGPWTQMTVSSPLPARCCTWIRLTHILTHTHPRLLWNSSRLVHHSVILPLCWRCCVFYSGCGAVWTTTVTIMMMAMNTAKRGVYIRDDRCSSYITQSAVCAARVDP